jgi:hypothetical protein
MKLDWMVVSLLAFVAAVALTSGGSGETSRSPEATSAPPASEGPQAEWAVVPAPIDAADTAALSQPSTTHDAAQTPPTDSCADACSKRDSGYEWARQHAVTDPDDCSGDSAPFVEGCRSYAWGQHRDAGTVDVEKPNQESSE